MPPKLTRSCSSLSTGMISGNSSRPFTNGYSTGSPNRRAKARNSAGERSWSRKKMTRCWSHARRMAATVSSERSFARSTPEISAPRAPATGCTLIGLMRSLYGPAYGSARRAAPLLDTLDPARYPFRASHRGQRESASRCVMRWSPIARSRVREGAAALVALYQPGGHARRAPVHPHAAHVQDVRAPPGPGRPADARARCRELGAVGRGRGLCPLRRDRRSRPQETALRPHARVEGHLQPDRKSTRLNSSHVKISYAVFCLKKKDRPAAVHPAPLF